MYETTEDYEAAYDESLDEDYGEARTTRRMGRPTPRVTTARGSSYRPPVPASLAGSPVTQSQLKEVTERINAALKTNGQAITQVDGRTRALAGEQQRLGEGLRKELATRKKEISAVRRDLQSTREMSAILPIVSSLAPGNPLMSLAPLLLLGNDVSGDSAAAGSGGMLGGLGGNGMGLIALVALSGALKP